MKVAYCTGFWATNIGNGFFSLGVEYVLKKILGKENVSVVSDVQTYANGLGIRKWPHKNQLNYLSNLDVDYLVLAGPVISKYFLGLWKDTLLSLRERGIGYILLSTGIMKMNEESLKECKNFFEECPPFIFTSRDRKTYNEFSEYAINSYDGICFSFFAPDYYVPSKLKFDKDYWVFNFDKMLEPEISQVTSSNKNKKGRKFNIFDKEYLIEETFFNQVSSKTDRITDAFVYFRSIFPQRQRKNEISGYKIIRTDHRFYPHFRSKVYSQNNSFVSDLPYPYINFYANSKFTLSDRVHACAATLAYGNYAMLLAKTDRIGLLDRVGANEITKKPQKIDLVFLENEKSRMLDWLEDKLINKNNSQGV